MLTNQVKLPIQATSESVEHLMKVKQMLLHAKSHAALRTEFDNMLAVLSLDAGVEYYLRALAADLELESITGDSFDIIDTASLVGSINKAVSKHFGTRLTHVAEIKSLRSTGNLVQHGAVAPNADLARFTRIVEGFISKTSTAFYGFSSDTMAISGLIQDPELSDFLKKSEDCMASGSWTDSIGFARDAFERAYFAETRDSKIALSLYPGIAALGGDEMFSGWGFKTIIEELEATRLGMNSPEYRRYQDCVECLPLEYQASGGYSRVAENAWEEKDATAVYGFVASTVLRWQNANPRKKPFVLGKKEETNEQWFGEVCLSQAGIEPGCTYVGGTVELSLLYVDATAKAAIEDLPKDGVFTSKSVRVKGDKREVTYSKEVVLRGTQSFAVISRPTKWGLLMWHEEIG